MTPAARISAAIEVMADIDAHHRPAADALKDWGLSHRFAGSGDRAAIASLVYDALRRRASSRWLLDDDGARANILGMLRLVRGLAPEAIAALFTGERHAPDPLVARETTALADRAIYTAPEAVRADVPDWLWPRLVDAFGDEAMTEAEALTRRAPLDLRVNTLKAGRDEVLADLAHLNPGPTPSASDGIRIVLGPDGRAPAIQVEEGYIKGRFEIQDEGSQLAAFLADARPGEQVLDLCAGGGGKTLALAAMMDNRGQIFATDTDARRLAPIHDRLTRAGVRNVQVRTPRGRMAPIDDLADAMDLVLVDAPCTGSGTWRRNPDSKWRLRETSLADRRRDQAIALAAAAKAVRPGGLVVYVTCSLLPEENDGSLDAFLAGHPGFSSIEPRPLPGPAAAARRMRHGVQLTPARGGTDGFYVGLVHKSTTP